MALPVSNADYLNALASVCQAAHKLLVPPPSAPGYGYVQLPGPDYRSVSPLPTYHGPTPSLFPRATMASTHQAFYQDGSVSCFQRDLSQMTKENRAPVATPYYSYQQACHPPPPSRPPSVPAYNDHRLPTAEPVRLLTPPLTPEASHSPSYYTPGPTPRSHNPNPVLRSVVSCAQFQRYLDDTWPEECMRRGSAIIRASLYGRIADVVRGGEGTTRFKHWVKKSEFFLVERMQPGVGYGACLAVPVVRSRAGSRKAAAGGKSVSVHGTYKLVARLEDFVYIIGAYHNDQKGHHGIRRTYGMIQEDFSYVPRTAVAKYIELCDICAIHRTKGGSSSRPLQNRDTNTAPPAAGRTANSGGRSKRASFRGERIETEIVTADLPTGPQAIITPPDSRSGSPIGGRIQPVESIEELGLTIDHNPETESSVLQSN